jgi:opacity protein-like surface antigen
MKKRILAVLFSAVLVVAAAPAFAAGPYYAGIEGGAVWVSDSKVNTTDFKGDASFDFGWGVGLVGGYDFGTFRLEGELVYRINGPDKFSIAGESFGMSGDYTSTSLMVNGYYDFKTLSPSVIPYLGVGIGASNVQADITIEGERVVDESQIVFAYQLIAGVAFPVSKELAIFADYRYFATTDPSFNSNFVAGNNVDMEYSSHNVMAGLRYNF